MILAKVLPSSSPYLTLICPLFPSFLNWLFLLFHFELTAIHNLANKYREEYKLPNLKLPFNNRRGFYFSIPRKDIQGKLPSKFIQVEISNSLCYFIHDVNNNFLGSSQTLVCL